MGGVEPRDEGAGNGVDERAGEGVGEGAGERRLLAEAVVQRVDVTAGLALLRLRSPGRTVSLLVGAPEGVGLTCGKPFRGSGLPGEPVHVSEKRRWRTRLEGARVLAVEPQRVLLAAGDDVFEVAAGAARGAGVTLRRAEGEAGGAPAGEAEEGAYAERGERMVRQLGEGAVVERRLELGRALSRARKRLERRVDAIGDDLARIEQACAVAAQASAFVVAAGQAPKGARALVAVDWSTGEPRPVELALDPAKPARAQLDALFRRARRLKLGRAIATGRLDAARDALAELVVLAPRVAAATEVATLASLAAEARQRAPRDFSLVTSQGASAVGSSSGGPASRGAKASAARPYRLLHGAGGARILVGRGAAHNDALTFHVARPWDLWLHAKGRTGAHVIVPLDKGEACPADLLVDAAHLAAHFSEARGELVVDVQHASRRHLRKPRGGAAGLVVVEREKVLVLRVSVERVDRLLATEEQGPPQG